MIERRHPALLLGMALLTWLAVGVAEAPAADPGTPIFRSDQAPAQSASAPSPPAPGPPGQVQSLSDERRLSWWANVIIAAPAHERPDPGSPVVKQLRVQTEDGTPEVVLALSQVRLDDGSIWVQVRLPMRPNDKTAWVRRTNLGALNPVTTFLQIVRKKFRAILFRDGRRVWSARIGIGRGRWPTPPGHFYVRERLIPGKKDTIYGVYAFGTSATSPVLTDWPGGGFIGIHGTNEPELIPGRISHGCVRVRNRNINRLRRLMPLGTPILVR
jgi:hypothetical protein